MLKLLEQQAQDSNTSRLLEKKLKHDFFPETSRMEELKKLSPNESLGMKKAQITIRQLFAV